MNDRVKRAGQRLSNVAFNLAQREGDALTARECESMRTAWQEWDAATAAPSPSELALRNVMLLAQKMKRKHPELAGHLLRFCSDAGVRPTILRGESKAG